MLANVTTNMAVATRYELLELLGEIGMGVVYRTAVCYDRIVAIKRMRFAGPRTSAGWRQFQLEAEATAPPTAIRIVRVIDVGEMDGEPFLAMEFIEGHSLERR
ncbi:MAG: hypothetical protein R3C99_19365 [Pirellulaceae bacterium]